MIPVLFLDELEVIDAAVARIESHASAVEDGVADVGDMCARIEADALVVRQAVVEARRLLEGVAG